MADTNRNVTIRFGPSEAPLIITQRQAQAMRYVINRARQATMPKAAMKLLEQVDIRILVEFAKTGAKIDDSEPPEDFSDD